jgi:uncharacterized protein GlcG (DUF336 family)
MNFAKTLALTAVLITVPGLAGAQTVLNVRSLSFAAAHEAASAALEQCKKGGYQVTITVLDRLGRTKVVLHDDGANPHTIENSFRKAYTSLTAKLPSGDYGKRVTASPSLAGILNLENITTVEGGLPIFAGQDLVGAIGISGAPGGDKDAACAQTGIERIARGLTGS